MQRGVDLADLDVSYVSSLALYFLLMFGLNDVYSLILGEGSEMDEQRMMQMQVRKNVLLTFGNGLYFFLSCPAIIYYLLSIFSSLLVSIFSFSI